MELNHILKLAQKARPVTVKELKLVKYLSDTGKYGDKGGMLVKLMRRQPDSFFIDSYARQR